MALPDSGPLSLSDIKGQYGGNSDPAVGDYYAGGSFVPPGTDGDSGPIPSSGQVSFSQYYGSPKTFTPITNTHTSGSGNETVPTGASNVVITVIGAGGLGGNADWDSIGGDKYTSGGGAGGAGGCVRNLSVASADWGTTIAYVVGSPSSPTPTSSTATGSLTAGSIAMTGTVGPRGGSAPDFFTPGTGSAGATGTGGNTNYTGGNGMNGQFSSGGVSGGSGGSEPGPLSGYGGGGAGQDSPPFNPVPEGEGGVVQFAWT